MITVGGLPGTGTSTLCKLLEAETGLPYTYAGQIFRAAAAERGMDLAAFGALCQEDPSVDQALDDQQLDILRRGDAILEGRLSGWLAAHHTLPAFKVWLTCEPEERLRRILERDGGDLDAQRAKTLAREASEADRYQRYYGADLNDLTIYDLVLDSTSMTPEALAQAVLATKQSLEQGKDLP
ncbi:MAG: (d)CMP kinase [Thermoplasmatota archaeon]